jgi:diphthamide biosynthesis methyltransferase
MVESASDEILNGAQTDDVAFLVVGDPFGYVHAFKWMRDANC